MKKFKQLRKIRKVSLIIAFFATVSCVEFDPVSPIPQIEYKQISFAKATDTLGNVLIKSTIEFSFIDGDADLGVFEQDAQDTNLPDSVRFGLYSEFFEKIDGEYISRKFIQLNDTAADTLNQNFLLPHNYKLDRVGQNKTVKGFIRFDIEFRNNVPFDTLVVEFYIRDRALNKSNVERTDDFSLDSVFKALNF